MQTQLIFGSGNAKLNTEIATFSLPAGYTCPFAKECKSFCNRQTGKIMDAGQNTFRCFSASQEVYPAVRKARWHNFDLLNGISRASMAKVIVDSMPKQEYIRVHVSGDFFSQDYFNAWMDVAKMFPAKVFYAYTKSIKFWLAADSIPSNFKLVASYGGESDALIDQANLVSAKVVFSEDEAKQLGLEIDHDDSKAIKNEKSFALLLHGGQPAGSEASKAWQKIKTTVGGYSPNKKRGV